MTNKSAALVDRALKLTVSERLKLIIRLCESLDPVPELEDWQREVIDERLDGDTEDGTPWKEVARKLWPDALSNQA